MSQPYVGEIRMFAGNFAPSGWMLCQGQLLAISEYETLFNLIGTTYGGNGSSTFALPDLQGRVPIHMGSFSGLNSIIGQSGGSETVTLTSAQLPVHTHAVNAASAGETDNPAGSVWAGSSAKSYSIIGYNLTMNSNTVSLSGGSQPHENMIPYVSLNFIISLFGIFPSQA